MRRLFRIIGFIVHISYSLIFSDMILYVMVENNDLILNLIGAFILFMILVSVIFHIVYLFLKKE